ncbi:MAG: hypothetical protein RL630_1006 [Verrucomicrobiota bacterium]
MYLEASAGVKRNFAKSNSPPADDLIRVVEHDDAGVVVLGAFVGEEAEGHDREAVAFFAEVGDGSIQHDGAAAAWGGDGVGLEPVAVRLIADENFLEWHDSGGFQEFLVDRHAALVVHIRVGDDRAVDFGAEKVFEHFGNLAAGGLENQHRRSANLAHLIHGAEELIEKDINHMPLADLDIHAHGHAGLECNIFVADLE